MADTLHNALGKFRDTMLSAVAELEFTLRHNITATECCSDTIYSRCQSAKGYTEPSNSEEFDALVGKVAFLETTLKQVLASIHTQSTRTEPIVDVESRVEDLLNVQAPQNTRNVVVSSIKNTPALSAAIAAAIPPSINLDSHEEEEDDEVEMEVQEEEEEEEEEEDVEMEVQEEDEEEEEEEEEEMEVQEEDEEEEQEEEVEQEIEEEQEEEEEGIEVEEFEYKGQTYQRDDENNVYLEGEHIGTWNGKRIVPLPA